MPQIKFNEGDTVFIGHSDYCISEIRDGVILRLENGLYDVLVLSITQAQSFLRHAPYDVPEEKPGAVFADAKVGDKVWHTQHGEVTIYDIDKKHLDGFYLSVEYDGGHISTFTAEGKAFASSFEQDHPTLFPSKQACINYWKAQEGNNA
jgi:hypothetical protein